MRYHRSAPILYLLGLCLVGIVVVPAQSRAQDWEPIVVQLGNFVNPPPLPPPNLVPQGKRTPVASRAPRTNPREPVNPAELFKRPDRPSAPIVKQVPPLKKPVPAPGRAGTSNIVTGTIGENEQTRHLSTSDTDRLGETDAEAVADDITRGTVAAPNSELAQKYCLSVNEAAADARIAWQREQLAETEKKIAGRIALLEAKTAEFKTWLDRRNEFSERATKTLVQIYGRMEPDSASQQLAIMDEETAAAVLAKLNPRNASAILNEMKPEKAARLTATIAGAARVSSGGSNSVPPRAQQARNESVGPDQVGRRQ